MKPHPPRRRGAAQPTAGRLSFSAWLTFCALIAFCIFSLHTSQRLVQGGGSLSAAE